MSKKRFLSRIIDVSAWMDMSTIDLMGSKITGMTKGIFSVDSSQKEESFEDAVSRLKLSDEDIRARAHRYYQFTMLFLSFAGIIFLYALYIFFLKLYIAGGITLGVCLVLLTQAFRYSYWRYLIMERELGCSVKSWIASFKDKS